MLSEWFGNKGGDYHAAGYFLASHPKTNKYRYANWGSRPWEYRYAESVMDAIGLKERTVLDIGIGLPSDGDFYRYYLKSGCHLLGVDPDGRLPEVSRLSDKCRIIRGFADQIEVPDRSVDVAVALSSLEHFPFRSFQATIKKIHEVLADDGYLIVTLDMTIDKARSARWAILEKTYNMLPEQENDQGLDGRHRQIDIREFVRLVADLFRLEDDPGIDGFTHPPDGLGKYVHSTEWNSIVGYLKLRKKLS